jgi:hypothetical protein
VKGKAQGIDHEKYHFVVLYYLGLHHEVTVFGLCRRNETRDLGGALLDLDFRSGEDHSCRVADMPQTFREEYSPEFGLKLEKVVRCSCQHRDAQCGRHGNLRVAWSTRYTGLVY